MKKSGIVLYIGLLTAASCGISQQEQEADARRREDSLAAAESAMRAAEEAARAKAMADSVSFSAVNDSIQNVSGQ